MHKKWIGIQYQNYEYTPLCLAKERRSCGQIPDTHTHTLHQTETYMSKRVRSERVFSINWAPFFPATHTKKNGSRGAAEGALTASSWQDIAHASYQGISVFRHECLETFRQNWAFFPYNFHQFTDKKGNINRIYSHGWLESVLDIALLQKIWICVFFKRFGNWRDLQVQSK